MRAGLLALWCALWAGCLVLAGEGKDKDKPRADEPGRAPAVEQGSEWLAAIERLRLLPRAGEIKAAGVSAGLGDIYGLSGETAAKYEALQKDYDAARVKLAAKWEQEAKALRAEQEAKMLQLLPEAKREAAGKTLDFAHAKWVTPLDKETWFCKEYAERRAAVGDARVRVSAEKFEEAKAALVAWVKETRAKMMRQDEDLFKQVREMLGPDEAARLEVLKGKKPAEQKPGGGKQ